MPPFSFWEKKRTQLTGKHCVIQSEQDFVPAAGPGLWSGRKEPHLLGLMWSLPASPRKLIMLGDPMQC